MDKQPLKRWNKYTNRIYVTIPPGQKDTIKDIAAKTGQSESGIAAIAIDQYLKTLNRPSNHSY